MRQWNIESNKSAWEILGQTGRTQGAIMTVEAGNSEGGPENHHPHSDQWMIVLGGSGKAIVEGKEVALAAGSVLLIEAGENHEIKADNNEELKTLNFYGPPADVN